MCDNKYPGETIVAARRALRVLGSNRKRMAAATHSDIVILLAEDEPVVRNMLRAIIQAEGYSFLVAGNGEEALALSRAYPGKLDLLLTDVKMPKLNGLSLSKEILHERPDIKILVISGEASDEIRRENITLPFLKKPFMPTAFIAKIRDVLAGPPAQSYLHHPMV
jgi:two-component system, cell cycle sensor histidine kinase and response regulator CckA